MKGITIILTFLIAGCSHNNKHVVAKDTKFKFPLIINKINTDTVKPYAAKCIRSNDPEFIGRYKLGDTIRYDGERQDEKLSEKDYLWEVRNVFEGDSLSSDGLQIIPDYTTSLAYKWYDEKNYLYYPVYIVNETSEPKVFFGKGQHGYAIQEALDTSDYSQWHAIESVNWDFCGNGRFGKKINPGEFLMFILPKYAGPLQTSLRLRFKIGQSIFISRSFIANIDSKQFKIDKNDWIERRLKETNGFASNWLFFGGTPKELYRFEKK